MKLDPKSLRSDGIVDMYRAANMLAKGNVKWCLWFLDQSEKKIGKIDLDKRLIDSKNNLYWAEKILDEYYRLRWGDALLR